MKTLKQIAIVVLVTMFHFVSNAAIITVSNNPNVPGQYSNLQVAIDAAVPNDTLYIQGSTITYGNVNLYKKLTLIGYGAMPNKPLSIPTEIGNINIKFTDDGTSSGSGSAIYGCKIAFIYLGVKSITSGVIGVNNITISRNSISGINDDINYYYSSPFSYSGISINNNCIGSIKIYKLGSGSIIRNNIISSGIQGLGYFDSGNWLVINNVIHYQIGNCTNGSFMNNVIYVYSDVSALSYCDFTNNIFYTTSSNLFASNYVSNTTSSNHNNSESGNIYNQNPDFVYYNINQGITSYSGSYPYSAPFIDYHLSSSSPGKNYGTDGTDIGIYGGAEPFVEGATTDSRFRYFPMPAMPQMLNMVINTPTVPANSNLNVNFTAQKNN